MVKEWKAVDNERCEKWGVENTSTKRRILTVINCSMVLKTITHIYKERNKGTLDGSGNARGRISTGRRKSTLSKMTNICN